MKQRDYALFCFGEILSDETIITKEKSKSDESEYDIYS
jgi:hypothetical protein